MTHGQTYCFAEERFSSAGTNYALTIRTREMCRKTYIVLRLISIDTYRYLY